MKGATTKGNKVFDKIYVHMYMFYESNVLCKVLLFMYNQLVNTNTNAFLFIPACPRQAAEAPQPVLYSPSPH